MALHSPWSFDLFRNEGDFKLWIIWAIRNGFVHLWKNDDTSSDPTGGLILRPVSLDRVMEHGGARVAQELFWTDQDGEISWIDFLWAPGQKEQVLEIIAPPEGIHWVGWQRRNRPEPHMIGIKQLLSR
jgi:hypothetical protein